MNNQNYNNLVKIVLSTLIMIISLALIVIYASSLSSTQNIFVPVIIIIASIIALIGSICWFAIIIANIKK